MRAAPITASGYAIERADGCGGWTPVSRSSTLAVAVDRALGHATVGVRVRVRVAESSRVLVEFDGPQRRDWLDVCSGLVAPSPGAGR